MRVLISGGNGYIGSFLCKELLNQGYEVAILSRSNITIDFIKTFVYTGQIEELKLAFEEFTPNKIIHLAADISKQISSDTLDAMLCANIILPAQLLQLSEEYKVERFINISTFSTSIDGQIYTPQTYYAATKKAAEDLVVYYSLRTDLSVVTLCFYDVYGPNQPHTRFLNAVKQSVIDQKTLHMSPGEQEICFLHVYDAVDAMIHALNMPTKKNIIHTYCVYGQEVFQLKVVPNLVADILELKCPEIVHDMPYRAVEIMKFSPQYPILKDWQAKILFKEGVQDA